MSVIGSYRNLTWSGSPPSTVHLNGTDNTPGTARTYLFGGATLVESKRIIHCYDVTTQSSRILAKLSFSAINHYSKPPAPGPYVEIHTTAMTHYPSLNLSAYIPWDGTVVTSVCDGRASQFNFTASFCANNVSTAAAVLHEAHISDAITVGVMLGGHNYTGCAALGVDEAAGPANATAANGTATASASSSATASASGGDSTGGGNHLGSGSPFAVLLAAIVFGVAMSG